MKKLATLPAIIYSKHSIISQWHYQDENGNLASIELNQHMLANNADMMLESCLQGVGIALLPIFTAHHYLKSGQLIRVLPEYKTHPESGIYAIFPQNKHVSTKLRLFIDHLVRMSSEFTW